MLKEYLISGKVQGVGYRYFVKILATNLKLKGLVQNLNNGQVRVVIDFSNQNDMKNIEEKIVTALKKGTTSSKVTGIIGKTIKQNSDIVIKDIFYIQY